MAHPLFDLTPMIELTTENFDEHLQTEPDQLKGVFFWGHDCPNCEVAKKSLNQDIELLKALKIQWYHVNTYHHFDLGTRFGLHGIPTFIFFYNNKRLGKISPFPGIDPFIEALQKLRAQYPNPTN